MTYRIIEDNFDIEFRLYQWNVNDAICRAYNYDNHALSIWFDKNNRTFNYWINVEDGSERGLCGLDCGEYDITQFEHALTNLEQNHEMFVDLDGLSKVLLHVYPDDSDCVDLTFKAEDFYYIFQRVRDLVNQLK